MNTAIEKLDWSAIRDTYHQTLAKVEAEGLSFEPSMDEIEVVGESADIDDFMGLDIPVEPVIHRRIFHNDG